MIFHRKFHDFLLLQPSVFFHLGKYIFIHPISEITKDLTPYMNCAGTLMITGQVICYEKYIRP